MEWQKIDPSALPEGEVLAANFAKGTYGYKEKMVGFLVNEEDEERGIVCSSESDFELEHCTHYIDIHKFDI